MDTKKDENSQIPGVRNNQDRAFNLEIQTDKAEEIIRKIFAYEYSSAPITEEQRAQWDLDNGVCYFDEVLGRFVAPTNKNNYGK